MMVGVAITSVMIIGLLGMLAMIRQEFFQMTLKQKAVVLLTSETERLSTLYNTTDFFSEYATHSDATADGIGRWIYRGKPNDMTCNGGSDCLVVTETDASNVSKTDFTLWKILFMDYDNSGNSATDENIIWIDRPHNVTAKLSWEINNIVESDTTVTNGAKFLTVSLQYPFRYKNNTDPAENSISNLETLT
ncbi:hypothetical protein ACQZV8_21780, partial [Magnetococcales bacterium HHB-1]